MNFILDGWIRSWRTSPYAGTVPNNLVWETTRSGIAGLVGRGARVVVAEVAKTDGSLRLVGFVCFEHEGPVRLLHYVFVKRTGFRGLGIGRALVDRATLEMGGLGYLTHRTPMSNWLLDAGWRWNPTPSRVQSIGKGEDSSG